MLKILASYSKKAPAEVEFSSQCFLASLEIEVADDIAKDPEKLHSTLEGLWGELKESVEKQITGEKKVGHSGNGKKPPSQSKPAQNKKFGGNGNGGNGDGNADKKASNKQIQFLIGLARKSGYDFKALSELANERMGKSSVYNLDAMEASALIEELKSQ